ncbi:sulfate transporter [Sorangium cellulosum]|uniref:Sulfate transporter n=1 Tax=Sorangium cellulosum TaxID=56 RepID=A0A4P2Q1J1_SORCE|nr:sulfate transporter [Sorangium cellulosum]
MQAGRVPIVGLFGNLIVSVQGGLTDGQVEQLRDDVTGSIESRSPRGLIVDLSGVEILDSYLTRAIRDIALTARLMGVRTAVCGLRPAVAIALVEMDLEIPGVVTALNLERAVEMLAPSAEDDLVPPELTNEVSHEDASS